MKNVIKNVVIALMFITVMAGCILLPSYVSHGQDKSILEESWTEELSLTQDGYRHQLTTYEKLQLLLFGYFSNDEDGQVIVTPPQQTINDTEQGSAFWERCTDEVEKVQEMGICPLPDIRYDLTHLEARMYNFINTETPSVYLELWVVYMMTEYGSLVVYMDEETGKIYSIYSDTELGYYESILESDQEEISRKAAVNIQDGSIVLDNMEDTARKWGEYLGLEYVGMKSQEDGMSGRWIYKAEEEQVVYGWISYGGSFNLQPSFAAFE